MNVNQSPEKREPQQSEIGRGPPPARTPEPQSDTDVQPDQNPVRTTPDTSGPGNAPKPWSAQRREVD
jgi:hypothetical protein